MIDLTGIAVELAWPLALLVAWLAGELGNRWSGLPRISIYAVVGFALASSQVGLLPQPPAGQTLLVANIALGLLLFEAGHRINLGWLRANPWIGATCLGEAGLTFGAVYALLAWLDVASTTALLLAALSMATSPATIVRVVNEQRSSGQVTERAMHLAVLNSVLAVFAFKVVVGLVVFRTSGSLWQAASSSLLVLAASMALGALLGAVVPMLLHTTGRASQDSTLTFAVAVMFLVALTHNLKLSPLLATLTFGLVARHRRVSLGRSQRGFGALGDILSVFLFVFIAATLEWQKVMAGIGLGLSIIAVRQAAKLAGIGAFAHLSGVSWRKGLLVGLAVTPISAFVILLLEQTRHVGIDLVDQVVALAAVALVLEIIGPILTQRALLWAHEVPESREA